MVPEDPRSRVLALLRRFGWNTMSFQVLEPGYHYWFTDDGDAAVAYFDAGAWWVAAGAPICDERHLQTVAEAFAAAALRAGRRVAFFGASRRLLEALQRWDCLLVGLEACWNPTTWSEGMAHRSQVRSQVRRASRKGVSVRAASPREFAHHTPARAAAEHLMTEWLRGRNMAPLGFLAHLDPFGDAHERRFWVAEQDGRLIGLVSAIPVYMRNGWFLEDVLIEPRAPHGTGEALIDQAMRDLEADGVTYASMGMVALAGVTELSARESRHPWLRGLMRRSYHSLNWLYGFQGLRSFRSKFKPELWEPVYLMSAQPITVFTVVAVLRAFAGGQIAHFVGYTGRKVMERLLKPVPQPLWWMGATFFSVALIPWILILLSIDSQRWFGTSWLGAAWASFDVGIAASMGLLGKGLRHGWSWTGRLNRLLLGAVLADTWMTTAQTLLYHGSAPYTPFEHLMLMSAIAAPYLAAGYLFLLMFAPHGGRSVSATT